MSNFDYHSRFTTLSGHSSVGQPYGPPGPPPLISLANDYTVLGDAMPGARLIDIPQARSYKLQRRYTREPSVYFFTHNSRGICLLDALRSNFAGLVDPDTEAVTDHGEKMTYMFEWSGYQKMAKQMNARRKKSGAVQSRSRIAHQVAVVVDEFIGRQANVIPSDPIWRVGQGAIDLQHIYLTEVKRISQSTWVVELAVVYESIVGNIAVTHANPHIHDNTGDTSSDPK